MTRPFADHALASRLEGIAARDLIRIAETATSLYPDLPVKTVSAGGGTALWLEPESPLNVAVGLGFDGDVRAGDLDEIESFYRTHSARTVVAVCPLANPTLVGVLARRGYVPSGFENVLVMPLAAADLGEPGGDVEVTEVTDDTRELWAFTVASGFCDSREVTPAEERLSRVIAHRADSKRFLAYVDGEPVGTGELAMTDDVAWLSADAVLPAWRGRGVQTALQVARLLAAREDGCELAVSESSPGSGSQRNMERRGFSVAYTRVEVAR